jgi:16S rRNA (adenine1518-N6/adenine1519-N6)-dimethyltransferase
MSDLRRQVISMLSTAGFAPLHRLGQNFMVDPGALDALCGELGCSAGLRVVEIGPGTGILTARLLRAGCAVLAVELDQGLAGLVRGTFAAEIAQAEGQPDRGLTLIHADCLESKSVLHPAIVAFADRPWRLGANLPYDVAMPVLLNAAALQPPALPPELAVVTVQWEAAQRLCSRPGEDAWGASAAVLQAAGEPSIVRRLGPSCFYPQPRVDSAILRWRPRRALPDGFSRWVRSVFSSRRKVLPGALRDRGVSRDVAMDACRACGLDPSRRLEGLSAAELVELHAALGSAAQGATP